MSSWLGKMAGTMEEYNHQSSGYCADLLGHDAVTCGAQAENQHKIHVQACGVCLGIQLQVLCCNLLLGRPLLA